YELQSRIQKIESKQGEQILITADEVSYDRELGAITARGNVEIVQGERVLMADSISYNQKSDTVSASGNISLMEPSGEVLFAEYIELTNEFKNGVIRELRILLTDKSRFAAAEGSRRDGNRTVMRRAVFSPCEPCKEDPSRAPLWQLKAEKIVHDQQEQEVSYRNAFLELFGVPVAYTPFFSHPDPTVYRRSGFLAPNFGTGGNLGGFVQAPFFLVLGDNKDMTISPIYTVDEGLVFNGEYRHRFDNGELHLAGSATTADRQEGDPSNPQTKRNEFRGHVEAFGRYDINETWRVGMDIERSTDRTYLRRFNFFEPGGNTLKQHVFLEGFRRRNYAAMNLYSFQDLRTSSDGQSEQPYVAPLIDFNHVGEADSLGGRLSLDANFRFLGRDDGPKGQRLSFRPGYRISRTADMGFVTSLNVDLQTDIYNTDQISNPRVNSLAQDGVEYRLMPRMFADWRFPFIRNGESTSQIVEPVIGLLATRNGGNSTDIPDEDSSIFEEDDTNLLSFDRLPGLDRVESGQRLIYGVKFGLFGRNFGQNTAFIGQTFRLSEDDELAANSNINHGLSDLVGRVDIKPHQYIDLLYRFRVDHNDLTPRRNEFSFRVGPKAFQVSGDYTFVDNGTGAGSSAKREEIKAAVQSQISQFWSFRASTHRDLSKDGGSLRHSMSLRYEDECITFDVTGTRSFFRDADIRPSDSLLFKVIFKHLGQVSTSAG
ncbi:MAG TPA: LPS-assembly protein LptD, partial [Rhodospirillaceae bacterium]|nr:LPS-assembly protein LptD [Rhodospirillaceae bacterium]